MIGFVIRKFYIATMLIFFTIIAQSTLGQAVSTWANATGGNWHDSANWDPAIFPSNGRGAVIDLLTGAPYRVNLTSNLTIDHLTINSPDATLFVDDVDIIQVGTATITDGQILIDTGTIDGGTWNFGPSGSIAFDNNNNGNIIQNGAILNTDLILTRGAKVRFMTGAMFTGDATLTGSGGNYLVIEDTVTITSKTINMDDGANFHIYGNNTVTLASDTLIRGMGGISANSGTSTSQTLVNEGTIRPDLGISMDIQSYLDSFINQGTGRIEVVNASFMRLDANTVTNTATINISDGSTLQFGADGGWSNAGGTVLIDATSRLDFSAPFSTDNLGAIDNSAGGLVWIRNEWDNTGASFTFDQTTGSWTLRGGSISGGTINPGVSGQRLLFSDNDLNILKDGLIYNGDLILEGRTNARFQSGAMFTGNATLSGFGAQTLSIEDTTTLAGKTINMESSGSRLSVDGPNTLTLAADTLVRGRGILTTYFNWNDNQSLINEGVIRADLGQLLDISNNLDVFVNRSGGRIEAVNSSWIDLHVKSVTNQGLISLADHSTMEINSPDKWTNADGAIHIDATSTLEIRSPFATADLGVIDNSSGGDVLIRSDWNNTGASFNFTATTGSWTLLNSDVSGGTITPSPSGQTLLFGNSQYNILKDGAIFNGDLHLGDNSRVRFQSGAMFTGDATLTGNTTQALGIEQTTTLTGNTINMESKSSFFSIDGDNTVTLASDTLVRGRGSIYSFFYHSGIQTLVNDGTIRADLGEIFSVNSRIDNLINQNNGRIESTNGSDLSIGPKSFVNQATVSAIDGSSLEIYADTMTNTGVINATNGSELYLTSPNGWSNTNGTINIDETSTLVLYSPFQTADLGTIQNANGGRVLIQSDWDNTGEIFTFKATTGSWTLNNGSISGGVIKPGPAGERLRFGGSTPNRLQDGLLIDSDLLLDDYQYVRFESGSTFSGNAYLSGNNRQILSINQTTILAGKSIHMDGLGSKLSVEYDNTLTLAPDTLVRGQGEITSYNAYGANQQHIVNRGTIRADTGNTLTLTGNIEWLINEETGLLEAVDGSRLIIQTREMINTANIRASNGSRVELKSREGWSNTGGVISIDMTSSLQLSQGFSTSDLGIIINPDGGTVQIHGPWDNNDDTFAFDATTGSWTLTNGSISGGLIIPHPDGHQLLFSGGSNNTIKNGAIYQGDINLTGDSTVRFQTGATFTGHATLSGADEQILGFEGDTLLSGKTINLDGENSILSLDGPTTLTIDSDSLVRGTGILTREFVYVGSNQIVNHGVIRSDLGSWINFDYYIATLHNAADGTIEAVHQSHLYLNSIETINDGTIHIEKGSTATVTRSLSGTGSFTGAGEVIIEKDFAPGNSTASISFGGDLRLSDISTLFVELADANLPGTDYDQINVNGDLTVGGTLDIALLNDYSPSPLDTFTIATFDTLIGDFDTILNQQLDSNLLLIPVISEHAYDLVTTIPADFNLDGQVDVADLSTWATGFGNTNTTFQFGDANLDGQVDVTDLSIWATRFGSTAADFTAPILASLNSATAIPEPSSLTLLILTTLPLLRRRRSP